VATPSNDVSAFSPTRCPTAIAPAGGARRIDRRAGPALPVDRSGKHHLTAIGVNAQPEK